MRFDPGQGLGHSAGLANRRLNDPTPAVAAAGPPFYATAHGRSSKRCGSISIWFEIARFGPDGLIVGGPHRRGTSRRYAGEDIVARKGAPKGDVQRTGSYTHPTATALVRPEVGTQAQFRKKKPAARYRYDSALSPALAWDGQNPAREEGEALIRQILEAQDLAEAKGAAEKLRALSKPFLDWAGKAERLSFDVLTLPLFIHERLSTRAILETLKGHKRDRQIDLFDLFGDRGHPIHEQVLRAYEHPNGWVNRMILGDSLVVMNSLLHYESLGGQVQMIYMDPPYGVKFGSNFQPFVRKRDVTHNDDADMTREPEMVKAYRDTWELGLHSYLTYLRDRLLLCRELLAPTGSIFVQISDENLHHVREVMDEVFGAENFCGLIVFRTTGGQSTSLLSTSTDFVLWFAKERDYARSRFHNPTIPKFGGTDASGQYTWVEPADRTEDARPMTDDELEGNASIPERWRVFAHDTLYSQGSPADKADQFFAWRGRTFKCPPNTHWKPGVKTGGMQQLAESDRLMLVGNTLRYKRYVDDFPVYLLDNVWNDTARSGFARKKQYVVETSTKVIERCVLMTTDPGDLVLDPTCGSGTTAYVAEQWGRRWITIDTSRVPLALARQRLLTATFPYYSLKEKSQGPAGGFVYVRRQNSKGEDVGGIVPHVTLKSIANGEPPAEEVLVDRPEIDRGITRVSGPFCVEATIPTPVDWDDGDPVGAGPRACPPEEGKHRGSPLQNHVDRMLEVLRKSPVLHVGGGKQVTLQQVRPPAKTLCLSAEAMVELPVVGCRLSEGNEHEAALQGSDCVAKGDVLGHHGLQDDANVSKGRDVRIDQPDKAGGDFGAEQYRGGSGEIDPRGVSTVPGTRQGIAIGNGDPDPYRTEPRLPDRSRDAAPPTGGGRAAVERSLSISREPPTDNRQLTTSPVAIVFGPENGAVSEKLVYEAAREAHAKSYSHLYVIAFAIEPHARKLVQECEAAVGVPATYVQATPDLMMGDLLKNMRASQIFSVCGLPEIKVRRVRHAHHPSPPTSPAEAEGDNRYEVELLGLDVFDPVTMELDQRQGGDVPAWLLDTDYNGLCFHVCQAFFPRTGAWEALKRALKGEFEDSVWDHLAGSVSAPFEAGVHQQIAVKVIDDRGNELMVAKALGDAT